MRLLHFLVAIALLGCAQGNGNFGNGGAGGVATHTGGPTSDSSTGSGMTCDANACMVACMGQAGQCGQCVSGACICNAPHMCASVVSTGHHHGTFSAGSFGSSGSGFGSSGSGFPFGSTSTSPFSTGGGFGGLSTSLSTSSDTSFPTGIGGGPTHTSTGGAPGNGGASH